MTTPKLQEWRKAIGPYGLNLITLDEVAEQALATDDVHHMRAAVFFIARYKYDDSWRNKTCTPERGMKHYHRLVDAIAVHSPLLAIATCFQAYAMKYWDDKVFFQFETAVVAHTYKHYKTLKGRDIEKVLLFMVSDLDKCDPISTSPRTLEMLKGLMGMLNEENPLRAQKAARYLLQVSENIKEFEDIFRPYTATKVETLKTRPPTRRPRTKRTTAPT